MADGSLGPLFACRTRQWAFGWVDWLRSPSFGQAPGPRPSSGLCNLNLLPRQIATFQTTGRSQSLLFSLTTSFSTPFNISPNPPSHDGARWCFQACPGRLPQPADLPCRAHIVPERFCCARHRAVCASIPEPPHASPFHLKQFRPQGHHPGCQGPEDSRDPRGSQDPRRYH